MPTGVGNKFKYVLSFLGIDMSYTSRAVVHYTVPNPDLSPEEALNRRGILQTIQPGDPIPDDLAEQIREEDPSLLIEEKGS